MLRMLKAHGGILVALGMAGPASMQPAPDTLGAIRARSQLICGVAVNAPGFALLDARGVFRGLDVDACSAVAATVLDDASNGRRKQGRFVPTTTQVRFTALQSGEVDMPARNTTWTLGRETQLGGLRQHQFL